MYYYIYRDADGNITAYDQTSSPKRPPAIRVTEEEFRRLGFYSGVPTAAPPDEPEPDEFAKAIFEGVNSV